MYRQFTSSLYRGLLPRGQEEMSTYTNRTASIAIDSTYQPATGTLSDRHPHRIASYAWAVTRISLGFVFLWAFVDKTFGLGYATPSDRAWINGGSPTTGFLSNAEGTFGDFFQNLAGNAVLDWLFMVGLLGIGVALILGIGMWVAAISATAMLVLMWMASIPLDNNPFMDDHLIYAMVAIGLAAQKAGDTIGMGHSWGNQPIVRRFPILR